MNGMREMMLFRQMYGSEAFFATAMLIGLFLVILWRRDQITMPGLFRLGVLFFALSIALPPLILPLIAYIGGGRSLNPGTGPGEGIFFVLMMYGAGPVLQALTVLCVYNAVMPRVFKTPSPVAPQKHPLDD